MKDGKMKKFPKHAKQTILHLVKNIDNVKEELRNTLSDDHERYPEEVVRGLRTLATCAGSIINGSPSFIFMEAEEITMFKGLPVDNLKASKIIRKAMVKVLGKDYDFDEALSFGEDKTESEDQDHALY